MPTSLVIKFNINTNRRPEPLHVLIFIQIKFFSFEASPESLNVNIIRTTSLASHTHFNSMPLQKTNPLLARKLAALITVYNLRRRFARPNFKASKQNSVSNVFDSDQLIMYRL